ncbi:MAG TPA: response regulator [Anaerolineales bacterium]|nr:response regulator [Anaerolineae bacterium]HIP87140.1 response regulator [Anaerolineales bacterium]
MARILVIDDNMDLLQMIRLLLEERGGHQVILAAEGEDGLRKAMESPPDLAIVDIMMPGMNGYEVCRRLRREPATASIPIIVLTARGQDIDRKTALEAGADLHIPKPVTMSALLERVNELLARDREPPAIRLGGTIALLSLRGGVGTTTIAVNLALLLNKRAKQKACLVDLSPSSGNVALQLGMRPDPNWSALALLSTGIGAETIKTYLLTHPSGLRVLAAPFVPVIGEGLPRDKVVAALSALRHDFPLLVIDLPSVLNDVTMAALENADIIVLVMTSDPASIQATLGTLQVLKGFGERIRLILNQTQPNQPLPAEALERVLRTSINGVIPFDPAQTQALAKGRPLVYVDPDTPLAKAVAALAPALQPVGPRRPAT